jgi:sterol 3beta-glucosyltransferase
VVRINDSHHFKLLNDVNLLEELVASSIHTIYRPVARSRRADTHLSATTPHSTPIINYQAYSPAISAVDGPEVEDALHSDEDVEPDEDFDATPHLSMHEHTQPSPALATSMRKGHRKTPRLSLNRVGSTLTVRVQRRAHLAEKLKEIFELDGITEVREGMHSHFCLVGSD